MKYRARAPTAMQPHRRHLPRPAFRGGEVLQAALNVMRVIDAGASSRPWLLRSVKLYADDSGALCCESG